MTKALVENEKVDDSEIQDCANAIKPAISAHKKSSDDQYNTQGFISLASALEALESLSLEHKSLGDLMDKSTYGQAVTA